MLHGDADPRRPFGNPFRIAIESIDIRYPGRRCAQPWALFGSRVVVGRGASHSPLTTHHSPLTTHYSPLTLPSRVIDMVYPRWQRAVGGVEFELDWQAAAAGEF